jgi:hypothetical protein
MKCPVLVHIMKRPVLVHIYYTSKSLLINFESVVILYIVCDYVL